MTNEQTALLLRQIAARIDALANEIEPFISDGDWVTEPTTGQNVAFKAVVHVRRLARDLETEADVLTHSGNQQFPL
ncbi:MAG: hypothetical protein R3C43_04900 [Chloroflexota bacterium]